ncbi:enolase C-terminal domain-like protein [Streptacidiphilus neutrinimicus]|uniref:enolase C-terminal domain-like protein n=1 Tax=Streptacidiphilus neutrinimicus TaxID=105420 RepID=UPI0007C82F16|nr:enolase C-terminal domain-like protein [Streptacidiphilus neutrinimicus]
MPDRDARALLHHVRQPMEIGFDHPAKRRSRSDSLLLLLEVDGASGLGECAPRAYVTGETSETVATALQRLHMDALYARIRAGEPAGLLDSLLRLGVVACFPEVLAPVAATDAASGPTGNNLACLLETALLDLLGRRLGLAGHDLVPGRGGPADAPDRLPVSQVLDLSLTPDEFLDTRGPFHFVKIKASDSIERDVRTVTTLRDRIDADVPVMVDANMSWTLSEAHRHLTRLRDAGADFVEEPLAKRDWTGLAELRARGALAIMLDESVCDAADARVALAAGACDAVNVRVAKNGGPVAAERIIALARRHGLRFQIGVQVAEVGPLINAGRALAFRHSDALTVEAGQSDRFFRDMVVTPRPAVDRTTNTLTPAAGPGFGLTLDDHAAPWAVLRHREGDPSWQPVRQEPDPRPVLQPALTKEPA